MEIDWETLLDGLPVSVNTFKLCLFVIAICLVQWIIYLRIRQKSQGETDSIRKMLREVESELDQAHVDRSLFHLESQILHELLSLSTAERTLIRLLRYFTPTTEHGFSAYIELNESHQSVRMVRGLNEYSVAHFSLAPEWIEQTQTELSVVISEAELLQSGFCGNLHPDDCRKCQQIYLVPIREDGVTRGILVSTGLFPLHLSEERQREFVQRLVLGVSLKLQEAMTHQKHKSELQLTREMLALRSVTDREYNSPINMIETFIGRLRSLTGADQICLQFLCGKFGRKSDSQDGVIRQGETLSIGIQKRWKTHEEKLSEYGSVRSEQVTLDLDALKTIGVDSLIGSALVVPLLQKETVIGVISCTRKDTGTFSQGQVTLAQWASEYLSETILRALNQAVVEREARQDGLTHLANRRSFDKAIQREVATAKSLGKECALGLFDLDHFKKVNDTFGHQLGDEVLQKVARVLEKETGNVRATDRPMVARYGGEELAVLLPGVGVQGATRIAEAIRKAVESINFGDEKKPIHVTISGGISCYPRHAETVEELIRVADQSLYQAKNSGRNKVSAPSLETSSPPPLLPKSKNRIKTHLSD